MQAVVAADDVHRHGDAVVVAAVAIPLVAAGDDDACMTQCHVTVGCCGEIPQQPW